MLLFVETPNLGVSTVTIFDTVIIFDTGIKPRSENVETPNLGVSTGNNIGHRNKTAIGKCRDAQFGRLYGTIFDTGIKPPSVNVETPNLGVSTGTISDTGIKPPSVNAETPNLGVSTIGSAFIIYPTALWFPSGGDRNELVPDLEHGLELRIQISVRLR